MICDTYFHGCCTASIYMASGKCFTSDGTSLVVESLTTTYNDTRLCPYGDLYLYNPGGDTGVSGHTCLTLAPNTTWWSAYWSFVKADGCMYWTDYFTVYCQ